MKNLIKAFGVVLLTLTSISLSFGQNTLLFKITGNGLSKPSFVFGTLHVICPDSYKLPTSVTKAVDASAVIYTEVEIATMQAEAMEAMKFMMTVQDSTLDKLFSSDEYKKVSGFVNDTLGMSIDQLKVLKPYAITTISVPKLAPCTPGTVEYFLIAAFPKKNNKGLETLAYQFELIMGAPVMQQAKVLIETVKDWNKGKAELRQVMAAYLAGDLDLLIKLINESELSYLLNQKVLIDNKNKKWVSKMPALMKKQSVFFAVGAGHLPGKNGVLELLKAKGYTVTPIALQ